MIQQCLICSRHSVDLVEKKKGEKNEIKKEQRKRDHLLSVDWVLLSKGWIWNLT